MKKIILKGMVLIFIMLGNAIADNNIKYAGQYYPEEFLLKGYDFFSEFNLDVDHKIYSSGTEGNEALISGNANVNIGSDSKSVAIFRALGNKALIIGTSQRGNRYTTVINKDSTYKNWHDLKGKKVGTRLGSGAEYVLRKYFSQQKDLNWDDFKWINLKTEDMIAAIASKQIEAFTVWAPTSEIAIAQGLGKALRSYGDIAKVPVLLHTTKEYAKNNRDILVKFLAGQLKKANLIKSNPKKAAILAANAANARGIDISAEAFELIFKKIDFSIDFDENLINEIKETAMFLKSQGKIRRIPEIYWDNSIIEDAKDVISEK